MSELEQGIAALKAGQRDEAHRLLAAAIRQTPNNERAWLWMYNASNNDQERQHCLEQALRINPKNEKAKQLLFELQQKNSQPPVGAGMSDDEFAGKMRGWVRDEKSWPEMDQQAKLLQERKAENNVPALVNNPASKKPINRTTLIIAISVLLCLSLVCCVIVFSQSSNPTNNQVKYVVSGTASSAFITYSNEQGGTEQVDVMLPFIKEWEAKEATSASIVAQNNGSGTITCEIWFRGEKIKTSTSSAQYGIATCSDFIIP